MALDDDNNRKVGQKAADLSEMDVSRHSDDATDPGRRRFLKNTGLAGRFACGI